jgi:hypothetical protein
MERRLIAAAKQGRVLYLREIDWLKRKQREREDLETLAEIRAEYMAA